MLYGLLISGYVFLCALLILLIMIQKSKSSLGLGSMGGGSQMLFGGSGGQDIFQKATWVLGALFIFGALFLSILRSKQTEQFRYVGSSQAPITHQLPSELADETGQQ